VPLHFTLNISSIDEGDCRSSRRVLGYAKLNKLDTKCCVQRITYEYGLLKVFLCTGESNHLRIELIFTANGFFWIQPEGNG